MTITTAFAAFGAKLSNPRWSVSALSSSGGLVISCWQHLFRPGLVYSDNLTRWTGNKLGSEELRQYLEKAVANQLDIFLVIARAENVNELYQVMDASKVKKQFTVRKDVVGKISSFDGDNFCIVFKKSQQ